ncbi:MAG: dicarboxylate/amino acid:cation symporter, partial [Crocinitomicaceae bacterium]|nr:dicarboxylate/amino acid:cation symporter [Crocinitomicaceae bacterium]
MKFWKKLELHWKIIIALGLGIIWSFIATGFFGGIEKTEEFELGSDKAKIIQSDSVFTQVVFRFSKIGAEKEKIKGRLTGTGEKIIIEKIEEEESELLAYALIPNDKIESKVQFYAKSSSLVSLSEFTSDWVAPWGDIFIRLLKLIAIPLVLFSIISGIVGLTDTSKLGRLGGKTIGLYVATTFTSVIVGLLLVNLFAPGFQSDEETRLKNRVKYELWAKESGTEIKDGKNVLEDPQYQNDIAKISRTLKAEEEIAAKSDDQKKLDKLKENTKSTKDNGPLQFMVDMVPTNIVMALGDGKLMLQVIFFAIFFGIALLFIDKKRGQPVIDLMNGLSDAFVKMVELVMKAAPFFVFCLMAGVMSKMADTSTELLSIFQLLAKYSMVVILGLILMAFVLYPTLIRMITKIKYTDFFRKIAPAQFLAFSTSSSAATLPVTIECVEENVGVSRNVSSFVLPIGATINMDGTSLYQAVAVIFLAQFHDVDLSFADQITIVLTATLASIGAAAVPSAGLVMLMIVLESVGLNPAWIVIIFPIDRLLDMCRTVVNVTGDATV